MSSFEAEFKKRVKVDASTNFDTLLQSIDKFLNENLNNADGFKTEFFDDLNNVGIKIPTLKTTVTVPRTLTSPIRVEKKKKTLEEYKKILPNVNVDSATKVIDNNDDLIKVIKIITKNAVETTTSDFQKEFEKAYVLGTDIGVSFLSRIVEDPQNDTDSSIDNLFQSIFVYLLEKEVNSQTINAIITNYKSDGNKITLEQLKNIFQSNNNDETSRTIDFKNINKDTLISLINSFLSEKIKNNLSLSKITTFEKYLHYRFPEEHTLTGDIADKETTILNPNQEHKLGNLYFEYGTGTTKNKIYLRNIETPYCKKVLQLLKELDESKKSDETQKSYFSDEITQELSKQLNDASATVGGTGSIRSATTAATAATNIENFFKSSINILNLYKNDNFKNLGSLTKDTYDVSMILCYLYYKLAGNKIHNEFNIKPKNLLNYSESFNVLDIEFTGIFIYLMNFFLNLKKSLIGNNFANNNLDLPVYVRYSLIYSLSELHEKLLKDKKFIDINDDDNKVKYVLSEVGLGSCILQYILNYELFNLLKDSKNINELFNTNGIKGKITNDILLTKTVFPIYYRDILTDRHNFSGDTHKSSDPNSSDPFTFKVQLFKKNKRGKYDIDITSTFIIPINNLEYLYKTSLNRDSPPESNPMYRRIQMVRDSGNYVNKLNNLQILAIMILKDGFKNLNADGNTPVTYNELNYTINGTSDQIKRLKPLLYNLAKFLSSKNVADIGNIFDNFKFENNSNVYARDTNIPLDEEIKEYLNKLTVSEISNYYNFPDTYNKLLESLGHVEVNKNAFKKKKGSSETPPDASSEASSETPPSPSSPVQLTSPLVAERVESSSATTDVSPNALEAQSQTPPDASSEAKSETPQDASSEAQSETPQDASSQSAVAVKTDNLTYLCTRVDSSKGGKKLTLKNRKKKRNYNTPKHSINKKRTKKTINKKKTKKTINKKKNKKPKKHKSHKKKNNN